MTLLMTTRPFFAYIVDTTWTTWYDFGARRRDEQLRGYQGNRSSGGLGKMGDSRFTILIVPNAKASCRKIKITSGTIFFAFIVLAILGTISVGTILHYLRIQNQAELIRHENSQLRASLQES